MDDEGKKVRLAPFGQYDTSVEILIKIGRQRFPLTVEGAKQLRNRLTDVLAP